MDQAGALLKRIGAFEERFRGTSFAAGSAAGRSELSERLRERAMGFKERVSKLFKGRVLSANGKIREVEVTYDFSEPGQLDDFEFPRKPSVGPELNRSVQVRFHGGLTFFHTGPNAMSTRRFNMDGDLDWTLKCGTYRPREGRQMRYMAFLIGSADAPKNRLRITVTPDAYEFYDAGFQPKASAARDTRAGGLVFIQKRGNRFSVSCDGKKLLEEESRLDVTGNLLEMGGGQDGFDIDEMTIKARLTEEWARKALGDETPKGP